MTRAMKLVFAAAVAVAALSSSSLAYAYWSTAGSGNGSATSGTMTPLSVQNTSATPSSSLVPGGTADLVIKVSNLNTYSVTIVAISRDTSNSITVSGAKDGVACTAAAAGLTLTSGTLSSIVASGSQTIHIPNAVSMSATAPSGCQGATFKIPTLVTVQI